MAKTTKPKAGQANIDASSTDAVELSEITMDETSKIAITDVVIDEPVGTDPSRYNSDSFEDIASLDLDTVSDESLEVEIVEKDFSKLTD